MPEERKLVSVLFADIVGSTSLGHDNDPEVVRGVLSRYFERVQEIVEAHGGTVEKFIGDAAMAVFGVPRVHDDDAERAVRAALAIQAAIPALNDEVALHLEARIGVNSGEVVAAVGEAQQTLVTGDVVNVAARLQQHAEPGEVLVGPLTAQLTRAALDYEEPRALAAKGKPEALQVQRALRTHSVIPDQERGLPAMRARLVGRARELRLLVETFERARDDQRPQLFTVVGNAGVGKSRLIGEFLARISGADTARVGGVVAGLSGDLVKMESTGGDTDPLTVLRGRCLPYGTGITYWPLMELLQADLGVTLADSRGTLLERLDARLAELVGDERARAAIRARLDVLLGLEDATTALPDVPAARRPTELGLGLGAYLEAIAARGPVVIVLDDLQWADPSVLEIVRGLLDRVVDVPLVVACIARPELLEHEPSWGAGSPNATTIVLEPLSTDETRTLIARLLDIDDLPEALRTRIVARADGNPLFCEEFLRMLIEEGRVVRDGGSWRAAGPESLDVRVPESIQALIATRLDALTAAEKVLVYAASIIGEEFEISQVAALAGGDDLADRLAGLARRGLVVPNRRAGPGAYRFRHLLIRDVAYATLPKADRARLHDTFGRHLEAEASAGGRRDELVPILAYHAERALVLSLELRMAPAVIAERARGAFLLNVDAADRAVKLEDGPSAEAFLRTVGRAAEALGAAVADGERAHVRLLEGQVAELRPAYGEARAALRDAAALAEAAGDSRLAGAAYKALAHVLVQSMEEQEVETIRVAIAAARRHFEAVGDQSGLIAVDVVALDLDFGAGRLTAMIDAGLRLAEAAAAAGDRARAASTYARLVSAAAWLGRGDLADQFAERAIAMADELGLSSTRRWAMFFHARLSWMRGDFVTSERVTRSLIAEGTQAGDRAIVLTANRLLGETLIDAGRLDEADAALAAALAVSVATGDRWSRTELIALRAEIRVLRGEVAEAHSLIADSEATLRREDVAAVCVLEGVRGALAALEGDDAEAERALRRAMDLGRSTEYWYWATDAIALAEFLVARGRVAEAAPLVATIDAAMRQFGYGLRRARIDALVAAVARQPA